MARVRELRHDATRAERRLWAILHAFRHRGYHFRRQVPIGPYYADIAYHHARLVIEADGATHSSDAELAHDARRNAYMRSRGFRILRVTNADSFHNADGVFEAIAGALADVPALTPTPVPSPQGGGRPRQRKLRKGLAELAARTGDEAPAPPSSLRGGVGVGGRDRGRRGEA